MRQRNAPAVEASEYVKFVIEGVIVRQVIKRDADEASPPIFDRDVTQLRKDAVQYPGKH